MGNKKVKTVSPDVKNYVLDTNILLDDPNSLTAFDHCNIILPYIVLEELDKHKDRPDAVGANARTIARKLNELIMESGDGLRDGIELENGSRLKVMTISQVELPSTNVAAKMDNLDYGDRKKGDNIILEFMLKLRENPQYANAVLVTRDTLLRCKSNVLEIAAEDYRKDAAIKKDQELYTGRTTVEVPDHIYQFLFDSITNLEPAEDNKWVEQPIVDVDYLSDQLDCDLLTDFPILPNTYVDFVSRSVPQAITLRWDEELDNFCALFTPTIKNYKPKNIEHEIALDMLMNPKIALCSLTGISGCGKSLVALAAAIHQTNMSTAFAFNDKRGGSFDKRGSGSGNKVSRPQKKNKDGKFDYIVVTKPVQPVGKDIGFLPGSKEEKMGPWIAPITDNMKVLLSSTGRKDEEADAILASYFELGVIEIEAITYMRGRSISNAFIIIDEAQNCSTHELKTILTHVGENSKIVLTGDLDQIDALHVNYYTSGLTNVIEKFKSKSIAAHITLESGIRSKLATEAATLL